MLDHATNDHIGWTEERTETLKKMWRKGSSARDIAAALGEGVTRNGVIGKVARLKLPSHGANAVKPKVPRVRRTPEQVAADLRQRAKLNGNAGQPKAAAIVHNLSTRKLPTAPLPVEDGVDVSRLCGLMDLSDARCRYPIGDPLEPGFGFCGDPTQHGSKYCSGHHKRVYYSI